MGGAASKKRSKMKKGPAAAEEEGDEKEKKEEKEARGVGDSRGPEVPFSVPPRGSTVVDLGHDSGPPPRTSRKNTSGEELMALVAVLSGMEAFASLEPELLDGIASRMRPTQVSTGEALVRKGEHAGKLIVLTSGSGIWREGEGDARAAFAAGTILHASEQAAARDIVAQSPATTVYAANLMEFRRAMASASQQMMEGRLRLLKGVPKIQGMGPVHLTRLAAHLIPLRKERGSMLVSKGEVADPLFIIKSGRVGLAEKKKRLPDSVEKLEEGRSAVKLLRAGDGVLVDSFVHHRPSSQFARTLEDCQLYALPLRVTMALVGLVQHVVEHQFALSVLSAHPAFWKLSQARLEAVVQRLSRCNCEAGQVLVDGSQFEVGTFGVVYSGAFEEFPVDAEEGAGGSGPLPAERLARGSVFGLGALTRRIVRPTHHLVCSLPGVCLLLSRADFQSAFGSLESLADRHSSATARSVTNAGMLLDDQIGLEDVDVRRLLWSNERTATSLAWHARGGEAVLVRSHSLHHHLQGREGGVLHLQHAARVCREQFTGNDLFSRVRGCAVDSRALHILVRCPVGGTLADLAAQRGSLPAEEVRFYAACIAAALVELHGRSIVHRNICPDAFGLDGRGYPVVVDYFHLRRLGKKGRTYTVCGTLEYMSPEMLMGLGYDAAADIWSFGVLLFELLMGRLPFGDRTNGANESAIASSIVAGRIPELADSGIPYPAAQLIRDCLQVRPRRRIGSLGATELLHHQWFVVIRNWKRVRQRRYLSPWRPPPLRDLHPHEVISRISPAGSATKDPTPDFAELDLKARVRAGTVRAAAEALS